MDLPKEGGFHNCVLVSVDKRYPLHARKVMHALWGTGQMQFTKCIVVVDGGRGRARLRPGGLAGVQQRRLAAGRTIVEGPLDVLDHSSPHPLWGGKIGIDATTQVARGRARPGVARRRGDVARGEGARRRVVALARPGRPAAGRPVPSRLGV